MGGINTATTAMAPYPTPVAGSVSFTKQNKGNSKPAMRKYKYKKNGELKRNKGISDPIVETMEEINSLCEKITENPQGPFKEMSNDINNFFKKSDEFIKKQKEIKNKKLNKNEALMHEIETICNVF